MKKLVKVREFIAIVVLFSLLASVIVCIGCASRAGALGMMEKIPEDTALFIFTDINAMRADDDLNNLYEDIVGEYDYLADYGIQFKDINSLTLGDDVFILEGKIDLGELKDKLEDYFNEGEYNNVEVWKSSFGWVAIVNNLIIIGAEDGVKDCLGVIKEGEDSLSDNSDVKNTIDRLPSGIMTMLTVGGTFTETGDMYNGLEVVGMSFEKKDADTIKATAALKFKEENIAHDAIDEIENDLEEQNYRDININAENEFIIVTFEIDIDDFLD